MLQARGGDAAQQAPQAVVNCSSTFPLPCLCTCLNCSCTAWARHPFFNIKKSKAVADNTKIDQMQVSLAQGMLTDTQSQEACMP